LEAAGTGKRLPSKQELLEFQSRWLRPAGVSAILGALLFAVSLPLQPSVSGDNDAERLTEFHDNSTQLVLGQGVLIGLGVLFFIPALYVLIRSAAGRVARIPRWMVVLAFVGPILFSVSGFIVAKGLDDVAGKFVDQAPAKERQARAQAVAAQAKGAQLGSAAGGQTATTAKQTPTSQQTATGSTTTQPETTTTPQTPQQAAGNARDDLASDLIDDSTLLKVGSLLRFVGLISFVFAMIYIPLWAMRTGLLTRFWAMLGLALGVSLLLVPVGIFGLVLWFAVLGLMLAGWWPSPLPPAWAAGEAIPWVRPGDDLGAPATTGGAVEGSGREVSGQPPTDNGAAEDQVEPTETETQGQRRKKRKRRG
jgi:hypothetical protein